MKSVFPIHRLCHPTNRIS